MILPQLDAPFRPLSAKHEILSKKTHQVVTQYASGTLEDTSYAVIGTFGAGKTQFLFSIFSLVLEQGLLPLYFLAEDLFSEIIKSDALYTQGDLDNLVAKKIDHAVSLLCRTDALDQSAEADLQGLLGPREVSAELLKATRSHLKDKPPVAKRPVLLVDELEVQYRQLQRRVQSEGDRSPLRELLSRHSFLKFFALAPAGIYEMGNADQTRVIRLTIPAADVSYISKHLLPKRGRANAAWWLSRGKARHLFKACDVLAVLPDTVKPSEASRVLKNELDHIGQHPTQVPAAVTSDLPSTKLPLLLDIAPLELEDTRCYRIDSTAEGEMADAVAESFNLSQDTAILFAEYFGATARALAGPDGILNVPDKEVPDLLALALDHLLEYEHGSPSVTAKMGELLTFYERLKNDAPSLYGGVATIWNHQSATVRLALSMSEIRRAFPFPLMNPIVKDHEPQAIAQRVEGHGNPLWRWTVDRATCLFFASGRDLAQYLQTDEFFSLCMPDGSGILALLPAGQAGKVPKSPLLAWFNEAGKLAIDEVPQLLSDFLLSAIGELPSPSLPGDLETQLDRFKDDKSDVLLSRKAAIYSEAIAEIAQGAIHKPRLLCPLDPPDAENSWGSSKIADRATAVCGVALAFTDLSAEHRAILSRLRDLFKGNREGRGAGDLNKLKPRGGVVSLADDVLPRVARGKQPADSPTAVRLQSYWSAQDRDALSQLARLVSLDQFSKLVVDEDRRRVLEALWRSTRHDFNFASPLPPLGDTLRYVKGQIVPVINAAHDLEQNAKKKLKLTGIEFGTDELFVKARPGFSELTELITKATQLPETAGTGLVRAIVSIFVRELDVASHIKSVQSDCTAAVQALDRLLRVGSNLVKNYYEFPEAMRFAGIFNESVLQSYVDASCSIRKTLSVGQLTGEMTDRQQQIVDVAAQLKHVQDALMQAKGVINDEEGDD